MEKAIGLRLSAKASWPRSTVRRATSKLLNPFLSKRSIPFSASAQHAAAERDSPWAVYAKCLNSRALVLKAAGEFDEAEELYLEAAGLFRRHSTDKLLAIALCNLGVLHADAGKYHDAIRVLEKSVQLFESSLGEEHPAFATGLVNLSTLKGQMGKWNEARKLLDKAVGILGRTVGYEHPAAARALANRSAISFLTADRPAASQESSQALNSLRRELGQSSPLLAQALSNLAGIYESAQQFELADPLYDEAVALLRRVSSTHPDLARLLTYQANLCNMMNRYGEAKPLLEEAVAIHNATSGEPHPTCAESLFHLADWHASQGDWQAAMPLMVRSLQIWRDTMGDRHPYLAWSLRQLASHQAALGQIERARTAMEEAEQIGDQMIGQVFSVGSERQRLQYVQRLKVGSDAYLSLIGQSFTDSPGAVRSCLRLTLRRKGLSAQAQATQRNSILAGKHPQLRGDLEKLQSLRQRIAETVLQGAPQSNASQRRMSEWNQEKERLESHLASEVPETDIESLLCSVDVSQIAAALPPKVALVEFLSYQPCDFSGVLSRGEQRWKPARYLAFVLGRGKRGIVGRVDLGEAERIDRLIDEFRCSVACEVPNAAGGEGDAKRIVLLPSKAGGDRKTGSAGARLREAVFDPLLPFLKGRKRLLLSPDGDLSRLPFETLPD